jgi:hypothetical protein
MPRIFRIASDRNRPGAEVVAFLSDAVAPPWLPFPDESIVDLLVFSPLVMADLSEPLVAAAGGDSL